MKPTTYNGRVFDVIPSPEDPRDFDITSLVPKAETFPEEYAWPNLLLEPLDQNGYGMCVAFSLRAIKNMLVLKDENPDEDHSSAFIYANRGEGDYQGEGMVPSQAINRLLKDGTCLYTTFPDVGSYETLRSKITDKMRQEAQTRKIKAYVRLRSVEEVKNALMNISPVSICVPVYNSLFLCGKDGVLPMPQPGEEIKGAHMMTIVGWNKDNYWLVLNSWGKYWGMGGYCLMPFEYPIIEYWALTDFIQPKPQPQPQPPDNKAYYRVQVGAFKNLNDAIRLRDSLLSMQKPDVVVRKGTYFYNVYVGKFEKRNDALQLMNSLRLQGFKNCFVIYVK